ncbi:MAG TPA: ATP-binding protein [Blastocatellia bacterium]|nr:ATP-binding protein [Blastocatellia bacterium]
MNSIRTRLALMIVLVTTAAVVAVGLLSSRATTNEFRRYIASDDSAKLQRCGPILIEYYQRDHSWKGVQQVLDRIGEVGDKQLILLDENRKPIATAPANLLNSHLQVSYDDSIQWRQEVNEGGKVAVNEMVLVHVQHQILTDTSGRYIGTLYVMPPLRTSAETGETSFIGSVNRSLIFTVLGAGTIALVVMLVLSRRIVRPIESLTTAVQRLEAGDLNQKVNTESKDELGVLSRAFNSMTEKLSRNEELRRNMVSDIAHELRTPLTNIRCQLETLQDGLAKAEPQVIDSLHEEAMRLGHLIDDLQELSLADAGQLNLSRQPMSINDEITACVNAARPQASEKQICLQVESNGDLPLVQADARRIGQVLRNLINNALAHTMAGGSVDICSRIAGGNIEISVRDTGEGISAEHLPYVFERFYRTDNSRDRKTGGAGLGLAIVKQLVSAHGGQVFAESSIGQGSTFTFTLPIHSK